MTSAKYAINASMKMLKIGELTYLIITKNVAIPKTPA